MYWRKCLAFIWNLHILQLQSWSAVPEFLCGLAKYESPEYVYTCAWIIYVVWVFIIYIVSNLSYLGLGVRWCTYRRNTSHVRSQWHPTNCRKILPVQCCTALVMKFGKFFCPTTTDFAGIWVAIVKSPAVGLWWREVEFCPASPAIFVVA